MSLSGAEAIVKTLERLGVRVVFGIPGGSILPLYDALYSSDIRHILGRHEQQVAHMADGYARASGKPGVCLATSGPGATNLVTGLATAYMDSSPVVAITGQVARPLIGKDAFQEADIVGIVTPITKHAIQVLSAREVPRAIITAFTIATTRRPGPVLVDVPVDVQREVLSEAYEGLATDTIDVKGYNPMPPKPSYDSIKKAARVLEAAERPVILAGGGVVWSGASRELLDLAELLGAPVATTLMGKGAIPEDHPLALGMIGMHGKAHANYAVAECDVLLAVGVRFSDRTTGRVESFAEQAFKIHVDIDASEINKNVKVDLPIVGDAKEVLRLLVSELVRGLKGGSNEAWHRRIRELKETYVESSSEEPHCKLKPSRVVRMLNEVFAPGSLVVTTGVGQNQMWAAQHYIAHSPRTFITSGGLGTMGFGLPAAIGAKIACPNKTVVDIDGDGSFLMTVQSLATSVTENVPVIALVLNNNALGMVRQWQYIMYGGRFIASDLKGVPDLVALTRSFGVEGVRVETYEELRRALREATTSEVTTVIDVPIPQDEKVFPMVLPGRALREVLLHDPTRGR
uniref:Acetolactate synthase n=1 Tax=Fervidicoccus fontis TaxID=683846 RepID=A0A7J3ZM40_9CREN